MFCPGESTRLVGARSPWSVLLTRFTTSRFILATKWTSVYHGRTASTIARQLQRQRHRGAVTTVLLLPKLRHNLRESDTVAQLREAPVCASTRLELTPEVRSGDPQGSGRRTGVFNGRRAWAAIFSPSRLEDAVTSPRLHDTKSTECPPRWDCLDDRTTTTETVPPCCTPRGTVCLRDCVQSLPEAGDRRTTRRSNRMAPTR